MLMCGYRIAKLWFVSRILLHGAAKTMNRGKIAGKKFSYVSKGIA